MKRIQFDKKSFYALWMLGVGLGMMSCGNKAGQSEEQAKSEPPPVMAVRDFFRNPELGGFTLSPSGTMLAFRKPYQKRMNVFVTTLGSKDTVQLTKETDRDVSEYFWKGDQRIVYIKDNGGDENFHLYSVEVNGSHSKELTPFPKVRVGIVDDLEDNEAEMLISMNKRNPEIFDVYRLNVITGDMKMVAQNPGDISGWITDHDGKIRAATVTNGVNQKLLYRATEKDAFKTVLETDFKHSVQPLFFSFDNQYIYASSNLGRDKAAIVKFDIANGKEMEVVYEHPEVDVSSLEYSRKRKVLTAIRYETDKEHAKFLDKETESIHNKLKRHLGDRYMIWVIDENKAEDKLLVRTISDRSLGANYFYDVKKDELTKLADRSPWLKEEQMAEMKPISYTSSDGKIIHGYLTLPVGKEAKNLPVVINPHGGPWARDGWGFNPEVQFLANRGYAVLQINFRGSTGYGLKYMEAGFKQWGKAMQQDLTDGVNWLIRQGIADPKRVAIYGGSYGGYATLAGITFTPELYACAIDYVGVSNLFTFMKTIPPYWKPYLDMMYEMVGDPKKDSVLLREASPVFYADRIRCPLFIAQGANDPRVNKAESDQMVAALKKRGIDVEYMVKADEGHGFHNEENRFDFYKAMDQFLGKHLGGRIGN